MKGKLVLPMFGATDPSGQKVIMAFSAANVKNADAVKDKSRLLKNMLRENPDLLKAETVVSDDPDNVPEPKAAETTSSTMLAENQTWTNKDGVEIKAAVQKVASGKVYFVMEGGKVVPYPVQNLSEATIAKLKGLMQ